VSARFLDDAARAAFTGAIEAIEDASAIEVVVAVRRTSSGYHHANAIVGLLAAFAGLAIMLFADHAFSIPSILIDPFVAGAIAAGLIELAPAVKRILTPSRIREREVRKAARATFVERGVHNTRDRSGLLVYISWLEQQVVVVPDSGLDRVLPAGALAILERDLTAAMRRDGAAVARQLEVDVAKLAIGMPRRSDDANELPDAIDSDLRRTKPPAAPPGEPKPKAGA
jgi:putative membrane protein